LNNFLINNQPIQQPTNVPGQGTTLGKTPTPEEKAKFEKLLESIKNGQVPTLDQVNIMNKIIGQPIEKNSLQTAETEEKSELEQQVLNAEEQNLINVNAPTLLASNGAIPFTNSGNEMNSILDIQQRNGPTTFGLNSNHSNDSDLDKMVESVIQEIVLISQSGRGGKQLGLSETTKMVNQVVQNIGDPNNEVSDGEVQEGLLEFVKTLRDRGLSENSIREISFKVGALLVQAHHQNTAITDGTMRASMNKVSAQDCGLIFSTTFTNLPIRFLSLSLRADKLSSSSSRTLSNLFSFSCIRRDCSSICLFSRAESGGAFLISSFFSVASLSFSTFCWAFFSSRLGA